MGFIAELAKAGKAFPGQGRSVALWQEVFGNVSTERSEAYRQPTVRGGSWGRSVVGTDAAQKRLIQALRSMAPGGWSDNRWEQTKTYTGIVYVAAYRLAQMMSQCEFQVWFEEPSHPKGKRPVTPDDPPQGGRFARPWELVKLLKRPNKQDSFGKWMFRVTQQRKLTGMALTWMIPNELGYPMELYSIPTAIAIPQPAVNPDYPDGFYRIQPVYPYGPFSSYPTPASAVGAPVPAQWMLRFLDPHPLLRYEGYSPQTALALEIDEFNMIGRSRHSKMRKGIRPSAVLNFKDMEGMQPLPEPEIERIHAEWESKFQGPENAGGLIVGAPGSELEEFGATPSEMDFPQSWEQMASFILGGGFGVTKPAAGMLEEVSYAALFASLKQLHLVTLKPDADDNASYLTHDLAPFFGDNLIVEIRLPRIDDHDILFAKLDKMMAGKCVTKNEVREAVDFPLTHEEWGEDIAGDASPNEVEQQQEQLEAAKEQGLAGPGQEGAGGPAGMPEEERAEPFEMARSRPAPGNLGRGSLGPRGAKMFKKSIWQKLEEAIPNGQ